MHVETHVARHEAWSGPSTHITRARRCVRAYVRKIHIGEYRKRLSYQGSPVSLKTEHTAAAVIRGYGCTLWRRNILTCSRSFSPRRLVSSLAFLSRCIRVGRRCQIELPTLPCQVESRVRESREWSYIYFLLLYDNSHFIIPA